MTGRIRNGILVTAAIPLVVAAWAFGTPSGREWRLRRSDTADLLAYTLANPFDSRASLVLGKRLLGEGRAEEAAGIFAAANRADPECRECLTLQGKALVIANRPLETIALLDRTAREDPNADSLAALGAAYYEVGNRQESLNLFRKSRELAPNNEDVLAGMTYPLADTHKFSEAIEAASRAVSLSPSSDAAWASLGYARAAASDSAGAIEALQHAVKLGPKNGRAWGLLAGILARAGNSRAQLTQAGSALDRAGALLPQSPLVPYYRGILLEARGAHSAAAAQYRLAVERKPDYTDALYRLSLSLVRIGRTNEGAEARIKFQRLNDYQREVQNLQIRIGRESENAALWKRMLDLAEKHGDSARAQLARGKLGMLLPAAESKVTRIR